jgi:SAM-dependent methyltransferase
MDVLKVTLGEGYKLEENQLLLPRLTYPASAYRKLTDTEEKAKEELLTHIKERKYTFQKLVSLCGGTEDKVISHTDRYGIPMRLVISTNSGLMRADPYFDEKSLSLFYQNEYRDLYSSGTGVRQYFDNQAKRGKEIYDYLDALGLLEERSTVVEIGCGAGGILYYFQQKGFDCYGCDYGKSYINYGKTKGVTHLFEGGFETLIRKTKADILILSHVLEHIVDPVHFLTEIKSTILSDNGIVFIAVPGMLYNHPGYDNILSLFCQAHVYYFTAGTLDFVCAKAGLERIEGNEKVQAVYFRSNSTCIKADPGHYLTVQNFLLEKEKAWTAKTNAVSGGTAKKKTILSKLKNYWRQMRVK